MAKANKITKEELEKVVEEQKEVNTLLNQLGVLESNKHIVLHRLDKLNERVEETKAMLENKYGPVNINLEDGTYTEIEDNK
jgi:hypothetical protein